MEDSESNKKDNSSSSSVMDDKLMSSEKFDGRILNFDVLQSTEEVTCCGEESVPMLTSATNQGIADVDVDCVKSSLVETTESLSVAPVPVVVEEISGTDSRPETPRSVASSITTTTAAPGKKNKKKRIRHGQTNTNRSENGQSDATNTGTESEVGDYDDVAGGVPAGLAVVDIDLDEIKETGQEALSVVENNNDNEAAATAASTNHESEGDVVEVLEEQQMEGDVVEVLEEEQQLEGDVVEVLEEEQQLEGELKVADDESQSTKGLDEVLEQTPSAVNVDEAIGSAFNEVLNYC
jgi:hypothetical protein